MPPKKNVYILDWITEPNASIEIPIENIPSSLRNRDLLQINDKPDGNLIILEIQDVLSMIQSTIIDLFSAYIVNHRTHDYPKGMKRYYYSIRYFENINESFLMINEWINIIRYNEVILTINNNDLPDLELSDVNDTLTYEEEAIMALAFNELEKISKQVISKMAHINVTSVDISTDELGLTMFRFLDENNRYIYASNDIISIITHSLSLKDLYGWRYLSDSPFTLYALSQLSHSLSVRLVHGIYIIPLHPEFKPSKARSMIGEVNVYIRSYLNQGYQIINIPDNLETLYLGLIERFGHELISHGDIYEYEIGDHVETLKIPTIIRSCTDKDNTLILGNWLDESVSRIIRNKLPRINIKGRWRYEYNSHRQDIISAKLIYIANVAYKDLVSKYPYLSSAIYEVKLEDDLSLSVSLTSKEELDYFNQQIEKLLQDSSAIDWGIIKTDDMDDMIFKRWAIYKKYPKIETFAVIIDNIPYIVCNQFIGSQSLDDIPWGMNFNQMLIELKQLYNHDEIRSLSYYRSNVPILDLGPPPYEDNKMYIVNREEVLRSFDISRFTSENNQNDAFFVNPLTYNPMDNRSLSRVISYPYGWMGFFSIRDKDNDKVFLPGLYNEPPIRYLLDLNYVKIDIKPQLSPQTYMTEIIMSVNVIINKDDYTCYSENVEIGDLVTIPLFDLSYHRIPGEMSEIESKDISPHEYKFIDDISEVIGWIWSKGWFISVWSTAIIESKGKIVCKDNIYSLDSFIKSAGESPEDGERTLDYLNLLAVLVNHR